MSDSFDVVVVGAGLAGSACALTLARNGVRVCVCERGAWPGEKSLSGMILYGRPLADLIPAFWKVAPVERAITRRRFSVLSQDSEVALDLRFEEFNHEPHNYTFSVLRSRFDRWFARQAAEAGATVFTESLVEHLLWEGQKVAGVRLRGGVDLAASVVVSCEGTNAFLVEQAGLRDPYLPRKVAVGVKEVLALPREVLQERFGLEGNEGVAMEFFGQSVKGLVGSAFLYTNQDTLSVGLSCSVASLIQGGIPPAELLAQFKQHPSVRRWLRGGERVEYGAQMIPKAATTAFPCWSGTDSWCAGAPPGSWVGCSTTRAPRWRCSPGGWRQRASWTHGGRESIPPAFSSRTCGVSSRVRSSRTCAPSAISRPGVTRTRASSRSIPIWRSSCCGTTSRSLTTNQRPRSTVASRESSRRAWGISEASATSGASAR